MITLRQIAREIHRILDGGQANTDSEYSERYTVQMIRSAMNEVLSMQTILKRQTADDRSQERMYIATYPSIAVAYDEDTERSYAELPEFYASLPYNKGVHLVASMDKPLEPMLQKLYPEVTKTLPAGGLLGQIGFYIEGLRVFWDEDIRKKSVRKVLVKLIVAAPDQTGLNDPLPITPDQKNRVRDSVIALYKNEGIQDLVVDSNTDLGTKITSK